MTGDLLERLKTEVLIRCGPVHTMLVKYGRDLSEMSGLWMYHHPDVFQDILKQYVRVGCDVISGNYGDLNRLRLRRVGLQDKAFEYTAKLTRLTREAAPGCIIEGALGPVDDYLEPVGNITADELYETWSEVLAAQMEGGGVDYVRVSGALDQVKIAIRVVRDHGNLPIFCYQSFSPTKKGLRTEAGVDPKTAAERIEEMGADIIGTQCGGTSLKENTIVLEEMRKGCQKPLYVAPNAGIPELVEGKPVWRLTLGEMAEEAPRWVAAGARIVGGCCGVTPEHIAEVARALRKS